MGINLFWRICSNFVFREPEVFKRRCIIKLTFERENRILFPVTWIWVFGQGYLGISFENIDFIEDRQDAILKAILNHVCRDEISRVGTR